MNNDTVVEARGLTKVFRDFWQRPKIKAVDGLDLTVYQGEIFGLLGPNGSGKSTTIKMLLGLLYPSSGDIRVLGRLPREVDVKNRIGYLPEESYLYNHLTPRETLNFYAKLFDLDAASRKERTDQLLKMVGLQHAADRQVGEFSKGMARRVGLAQALINDPELIILDEPTSGLDPIGCRQVKDIMLTLAQRGKTIILSSHLLADVEDVCDHVSILYSGRTQAYGRVNELLEESDRVRLTIPALEPDVMKAVIEAIRSKIGSEPYMDKPSMNLEQFFLEVVEKAHRSSAYSTGTSETSGVAEFLSSR